MKSYSNLVSKYYYLNDDGEEVYLSATNTTDGNMVVRAQQAPLYFAMNGLYQDQLYSNNDTDRSSRSYYWTRTAYNNGENNYFAYYFNVATTTGNFYPQDHNGRKINSMTLRCVFEGSTVEDNMYMQDINLTMCNNLAESTASSDNRKTVIDARDGKSYQISHLADGNCWMVSNLALDGNRTLQPVDSNVTENRVLPENITLGTTADREGSTTDTPQIYGGLADITTTDCGFSEYCVVNEAKYGNYYNWTAATATVGKKETPLGNTISESACPLNWRLPDGGTATNVKSWPNLVKEYSYELDGTTVQLSSTIVTDANMVKRVQEAPLYISLPGNYVNESVGKAGTLAHYWTRTPSSNTGTRNAFFSLDNDAFGVFDPNRANGRYYLFSVRCVLGE